MDLYPLTKPQRSIWDIEQYYGGAIGNITGTTFFCEPVDFSALRNTLEKLFEHHDSLRIRIKIQNGTPMQYIAPYTKKEVKVMRFNSSDDFDKWINTLARTPFDIGEALSEVAVIEVEGRIGYILHQHHLISDAWTIGILANTVAKALKGEDLGCAHSYLDYIEAEKEYATSTRREKDKAYFFSCFEKSDEPTSLSDQHAKSTAAERMNIIIDNERSAKLTAFCENNNISPYAVFMSALAVYIYRIKDEQNAYIGTAILNRSNKKEKSTAGMYINTVPVLMQIDKELSMIKNMQNNLGSIMNILRHQRYQYSEFLSDIRDNFGFTGKLYDVILSYQNTKLPSELTPKWIFSGCQSEALNIHIDDRQNDGIFNIDLSYQTELFAEQDIHRLSKHWLNLISEIIENSDKKPHELKMLSDDEFCNVVYSFNDTAIEYPEDKCIHQLFEEQVEQSPDETALIFEGKKYTYHEINNMANSLAHLLREKGVGRNDIVAIIAKRSYKIIVAQLAILKAGGAYMFIEPDYPPERIEFMLKETQCKEKLVFDSNYGGIDLANDSLFSCNTYTLENINSPEDLCYVIYTSGSTGQPKGVLISQRNFVNFCNNNNNNNQVQSAITNNCHVFLCLGSFTFDMASAEVYLALLNNRPVVLANSSQTNDPELLAQLMDDNKVDFMLSTPTKVDSYINYNAFSSAMRGLKVISLGGEVLTQKMISTFKEHTSAVVLNGYGPAETTQGCCWTWSDGDTTIGKPIANTQIYILDSHQNPLPIGAVGELCISGDGVGRGYLNRPELTAEKFVPNPFIEGKRMYKTGDRAKWRDDGNIEYIGRMDNQVKIRGLRIELGEIEAAMSSENTIKQSAVVVKKDESDRQYICAYYSCDEAINETKLRKKLAKTLPQYMIPHFFTRIETFPTTSSGKTDRNALPAPDFTQSHSTVEYIAPTTEQEKQITKILETVLGITKIGMNDNFFDLGGDSLKAIEFIANAHHEGINIQLQDVFEHPTPALLLESLDGETKVQKHKKEDFDDLHWLLSLSKQSTGMPQEKHPLGDTVITGATGWLGAHVLDEYLSSETGKAYCLVRGADLEDSRRKLKAVLENYFGDKHKNNERIVAICGDVKDKISLAEPIQAIIHCAANVKHYGVYQNFHDANVTGTENVIALAKEKDALLLHISTAAVSGNGFDIDLSFPKTVFDEAKLCIGQPLDNVYVRSKFEAETAVLRARADGLNAVIIRVGNLTNRRSDLKFQKNHNENATLTRLKAIADLGKYPRLLGWMPLEFSPVDDTAKAIIKIAQHYDRVQIIYHAYHNKAILLKDFIKALKSTGIKIKPVSTKRFREELDKAAQDPKTAHIFEAFVNDISTDGDFRLQSKIELCNAHTTGYLERAGFVWEDVDERYLREYVEYFRGVGWFGGE